MKRNERTIINHLRKHVNADTINVQVKHSYSPEAQQAIHELLTIEKGFFAVRVCPDFLDYEPVTLYIPASTPEQKETRKTQETLTAAAVVATLPESEYTWNGYKKPDPDITPDPEPRPVKKSSVKRNDDGSAMLTLYSDGKTPEFTKKYNTFRGAEQAASYYIKHGIPVKSGYNVRRMFEIVNAAILEDKAVFHAPRDNSKLHGIPAFNLAPGRTCSPEACAHCLKDGCYAVKNMLCHGYDVNNNYCLRAWTENTALAVNHVRKLEKLLDNWLTENKPELFRIHSAGDFFSVAYARMWKRIIKNHPETRFLAFTKQFDILRAVPFHTVKNAEIVLSGWTGVHVPEDLRKHYRVAWCDDGQETRIPENAHECPGDCNNCRVCWTLSELGIDTVFHKH